MDEVRIRRDEHRKAGLFRRGEQFAILQSCPGTLVGRGDIVLRQEQAKWCGCSLVKKYLHLRRRQGATCSVLEYRANLFERYTGKPLDEFANRRAILKILEQRGDGHPRAAKNPSAAIALRVALDSFTCRPVDHA